MWKIIIQAFSQRVARSSPTAAWPCQVLVPTVTQVPPPAESLGTNLMTFRRVHISGKDHSLRLKRSPQQRAGVHPVAAPQNGAFFLLVVQRWSARCRRGRAGRPGTQCQTCFLDRLQSLGEPGSNAMKQKNIYIIIFCDSVEGVY